MSTDLTSSSFLPPPNTGNQDPSLTPGAPPKGTGSTQAKAAAKGVQINDEIAQSQGQISAGTSSFATSSSTAYKTANFDSTSQPNVTPPSPNTGGSMPSDVGNPYFAPNAMAIMSALVYKLLNTLSVVSLAQAKIVNETMSEGYSEAQGVAKAQIAAGHEEADKDIAQAVAGGLQAAMGGFGAGLVAKSMLKNSGIFSQGEKLTNQKSDMLDAEKNVETLEIKLNGSGGKAVKPSPDIALQTKTREARDALLKFKNEHEEFSPLKPTAYSVSKLSPADKTEYEGLETKLAQAKAAQQTNIAETAAKPKEVIPGSEQDLKNAKTALEQYETSHPQSVGTTDVAPDPERARLKQAVTDATTKRDADHEALEKATTDHMKAEKAYNDTKGEIGLELQSNSQIAGTISGLGGAFGQIITGSVGSQTDIAKAEDEAQQTVLQALMQINNQLGTVASQSQQDSLQTEDSMRSSLDQSINATFQANTHG